jgi:hypothetical protein
LAGGLGDGAETTYGFVPAGGTTGGGGGVTSSGDRRGYAACSGAEASGWAPKALGSMGAWTGGWGGRRAIGEATAKLERGGGG